MPTRPPRIAPKTPPRSRRSTTKHAKLYGSQAWRKASEQFRSSREGALCVDCKARGKLVPSEITDHIVPHDGDLALFWDPNNWAGRCWSCHSAKSRAQETEARTGQPRLQKGCTPEGWPIDRRHHWWAGE